jgi:hypothetical protein
MVDPEPSDSSSDSDNEVSKIIEVFSDSDVEEMKVEPKMDIVVREKLILKIPRSISLRRNKGLKAITVIIIISLAIMC